MGRGHRREPPTSFANRRGPVPARLFASARVHRRLALLVQHLHRPGWGHARERFVERYARAIDDGRRDEVRVEFANRGVVRENCRDGVPVPRGPFLETLQAPLQSPREGPGDFPRGTRAEGGIFPVRRDRALRSRERREGEDGGAREPPLRFAIIAKAHHAGVDLRLELSRNRFVNPRAPARLGEGVDRGQEQPGADLVVAVGDRVEHRVKRASQRRNHPRVGAPGVVSREDPVRREYRHRRVWGQFGRPFFGVVRVPNVVDPVGFRTSDLRFVDEASNQPDVDRVYGASQPTNLPSQRVDPGRDSPHRLGEIIRGHVVGRGSSHRVHQRRVGRPHRDRFLGAPRVYRRPAAG
mmetsp:Transcript_10618/g.42832  ORF Transcript_10618/g.42832 Transcript_10618/m.42832 type:complete len:353 (+) Transcript_10618:169-1227(+)